MFSSTQMSWGEPYFFVIRLREPWGWGWRIGLAVVISVVLFVSMFVFRNPRPELLSMVGISLLAGFVLVLLLDIGNIQREVTIKEDCIIYQGMAGESWMGSFAFKDVRRVQLMRPEDWKKPYGAMLVHSADDIFLLGVPNKIALNTVADVLHRLGVSVDLQGWEPSETDTRVQVKDEVVVREGAGKLSRAARIWAVESTEPRLIPHVSTAIGLIIALGPLLLSFLGLIGSGISLFMQWNALDWTARLTIGGIALVAFIASFVYLVLAGQFLAMRYVIGVAKGQLRTRANAQFPVWDPELLWVEIYDRSAWTSTIVKAVDDGFLRIDSAEGCLKFEGHKNRWDIPTASLTACRIEEAKVGSEGNPNAEVRYYVVISCDRDGEPWEAGMINMRTELGNEGKEQKYARAQAMFGRISQLVPPA